MLSFYNNNNDVDDDDNNNNTNNNSNNDNNDNVSIYNNHLDHLVVQLQGCDLNFL